MMSKIGFKLFVGSFILIGSTLVTSSANAQDPGFGFSYGYSVGQSRGFRSNLPTPPYFSIYPPVYYGKKYARPYGDSPYASWPTLQSNPSYRPEPKLEAKQIANPYCLSTGSESLPMPPSIQTSAPVAMGKKVTIVNPFVVQAPEKFASN